MRGRAMNFDADSFPFSHFALRLQRPPGGSLCDIRENAEYFLPLRLNPYVIVVLRAVLISHPSRAEGFSSFAEFVLQLQRLPHGSAELTSEKF